VKPLDLKIEWMRSTGVEVEQRGEAIYIWAKHHKLGTRRVWIVFGNPTYRCLREGLRKHFFRWGGWGWWVR